MLPHVQRNNFQTISCQVTRKYTGISGPLRDLIPPSIIQIDNDAVAPFLAIGVRRSTSLRCEIFHLRHLGWLGLYFEFTNIRLGFHDVS